MSIAKIEIEKYIGSDNPTYSEMCAQCGGVNRAKFRVALFENRQQFDPLISYNCIRCLVSLSYSFLRVKRSGR